MKSVYISLSIFFIMLIFMLFSISYLNKVCIKLEKESNNLEEIINKGDWDEAYITSKDLLERWEIHSRVLPMFENHEEIDTLSSELLKLTQYVKCKNKSESLASVHAVKFYFDNMKSLQKINFQNIF